LWFVFSADEPLFWVERKAHGYSVVNEGTVVRFQENRLSGPRKIAIIVFLMFVILPVAFSIAIIADAFEQEAVPILNDGVGCGEGWIESGDLLPGKLYCVSPTGPEVIPLDSLEVSDDQHIRETSEGDVFEYRWEAVEDYLVFGSIVDGEYECMTFLPQDNLDDEWTYADLSIRVGQYNPDWCGSAVDDSTRNYSADEPHPYDGIWLYDVEYGDPMNRLTMLKFDELNVLIQDGESEAYMQDGVDFYETEGAPLGLLCITLPISLLFLAGADPRKRALYFHVGAGKVVRRRVGRWPSFQTTWADVDFSSASLNRTVRIQEHVEHDENGPSRRWTTQHPGFDLRLSRKNGPIIPVFFDDGGDLRMHESIILALLKGLNVGEERFRSHLEEAPKNQPAIEEASPAQMEHEDTTAPAETPLEGASGSFWNIEGDKNP
jgi:hypothetical protein